MVAIVEAGSAEKGIDGQVVMRVTVVYYRDEQAGSGEGGKACKVKGLKGLSRGGIARPNIIICGRDGEGSRLGEVLVISTSSSGLSLLGRVRRSY